MVKARANCRAPSTQTRERATDCVAFLFQEYDQAFYPRLVIVLILVLAALMGLGGVCVTHIGKPVYVSAT